MGLSLQFAIGNKQTIIDAAEKFDLDFFEKLEAENQLADFSLHLIPDDLNFLVSFSYGNKRNYFLRAKRIFRHGNILLLLG